MTLADLAFKEHFSIEEVRKIIKCVDKPCDEYWAYKQLNKYHFHFKMLFPNKDQKIKTLVKKSRQKAEYSKKHIEKLSYVLNYIDNPENDLTDLAFDEDSILITIAVLSDLLEFSKNGYLCNEEYFSQKRTKLQSKNISTYLVGVLIPQLYEEIFQIKWTYTTPCIEYDIPDGPGIRFTQEIFKKYKSSMNNEAIAQAYQRAIKAIKQ